jgi:hypothetical protein
MGASDWGYFVPYQPDIFKALQELREVVFRQGKYYKRRAYWKSMTFEQYLPADPGFSEQDKAMYLASFQRLQALSEPTSIDTLLAWNGEEGTHSIIDITSISPMPGICSAAPLSNEELEEFFDTPQPSREMIENDKEDLMEFLQYELGRYRGEATFIIVYKDGKPDEIFFTGYSGD